MFGLKRTWKCQICGMKHDEVPNCFGIEAPWRAFVPEAEFETRVELSESWCVVDDEHFFVRGHVEIPIIKHPEPFAFSVWSSLSRESFEHMQDRWLEPDRGSDAPYFGWLSSPISPYENALLLPLSVQSREPGLVPVFTVTDTTHTLAIDQENGISIRQWHNMAVSLLH